MLRHGRHHLPPAGSGESQTYQAGTTHNFHIHRAESKIHPLELQCRPCRSKRGLLPRIPLWQYVPSLDIFLHADVNLRTEHIQKLGLNGKEDPRKYLTKMDNLRETYFKTYTKHELGTYHDYDLCLDTGTLGYDNCIEIITSLAKQQGLNLKHQ